MRAVACLLLGVLLACIPGQAPVVAAKPPPLTALTPDELWALREDARDAFYHAYDAYMAHGWPWDEVKPLACVGRRWDKRERGTLDDSLGGFHLTLIDALDSLAVLGDAPEFRAAVHRIAAHVSFDRDVTVSVFETNIRVLGGLLSAHVLATDDRLGLFEGAATPYDGSLLRLALDLGWRLMPAFSTPTGLPYHRVNLRSGVMAAESKETCTAAAGTFLIEFGLLSRLTGVPDFEATARAAIMALWDRRSNLDLLGTNIDVDSGLWRNPNAGVGAGVDSFHEYLFKAAVLFDDDELMAMYHTTRDAVVHHLEHNDVHLEASMYTGVGASRPPYISALQCFWPGLEASAGFVGPGARSFRPLMALWEKFNAMPDMFDLGTLKPVHYAKDSPLRPELVESAYMLFSATQHLSYLHAGASMLKALLEDARVTCGFASIADVNTKRLDDRMDSYFLSETTKYLFLLFDAALAPEGHAATLYRDPRRPTPASFRFPLDAASRDAALRMGPPVPPPVVQDQVEVGLDGRACVPVDGGEGVACSGDRAGSPVPPPNTTAALTPEAAWVALPHRLRLAATVRSDRSPQAALPFARSEALFTTEGHLFLLTPRLLDVDQQFAEEAAPRRRRTPKPPPSRKSPPPGSRAPRALTAGDNQCPVMPAQVSVDGRPRKTIEAYAKRTREKVQQKQRAAKEAAAVDDAVNAAQAPTTTIAAKVTPSGKFHVEDWSQEVAFSKTALQRALDSASLAAAGVESIVINCDAQHQCFAMTSIASSRRIFLGLTHDPNHAIAFEACSAQFGPLLSSTGIENAYLAVASPFNACIPVTADRPVGVPEEAPLVVLVARGGCSFVTKARHVEAWGGAAVMVLDGGIVSFDKPKGTRGADTRKATPLLPDAMRPLEFAMADDGTGVDIGIPAVMLSTLSWGNASATWGGHGGVPTFACASKLCLKGVAPCDCADVQSVLAVQPDMPVSVGAVPVRLFSDGGGDPSAAFVEHPTDVLTRILTDVLAAELEGEGDTSSTECQLP